MTGTPTLRGSSWSFFRPTLPESAMALSWSKSMLGRRRFESRREPVRDFPGSEGLRAIRVSPDSDGTRAMAWVFRLDPESEGLRFMECKARDKPESDGFRVMAWRVEPDSEVCRVRTWGVRLDPESDGLRAREWNILDEADRGSVGVLLTFLSSLGGERVTLIERGKAADLPSERTELRPSAVLSRRELSPPRLLPRRELFRAIGAGRDAISFSLAAAS
jgi:hypothetical protein